MKILVFSPYYPPHRGGLETHSDEWNAAVGTLGYSVTVFTPCLPVGSPQEEIRSWGKILRYPAFEIISGYPLPCFWSLVFWQQLFSLVKKENRPTCVITRTRFFFSSFIGLLYARAFSLPHIHIEHGSNFVVLSSPVTSFLARLYDFSFGYLVFHFSTINIPISEAVQRFITRFDKRPTTVIYRGINFEEILNIPEAEKEEGKIILVTAARLYAWKGISNSLQALRLLPEEILSQVEFHIIGDGEDRNTLEKSAAGLPVVFLGSRPRQEVIAKLKSSDIFIHSSYPGGGLSTSLLEALACKNAVVATPHEGANEIINHQYNGLLLKKSDPKEISVALLQLIEDPKLRHRLAENGVTSVIHQFNWDKSKEQYHKILTSL